MALDIEITWEDTPFQPARVIPAVPAKTITYPYPEGYVRAIAANPGSGLRKEFVKACQKWVEENPEKIDLDKLAPGSVFKDTLKPFGGPDPALRILTKDGWVDTNLDPTGGFMGAYRNNIGGRDRYKPIVLVYKD